MPEIPLLLTYCSSRERSSRSCPIAPCRRGCCGEAIAQAAHFARYSRPGQSVFIGNVGDLTLSEGIAEYCRRKILPFPEVLPRPYSDERAGRLWLEALADIAKPENSPCWLRWKNRNPNLSWDAYEAGYYAVNKFMEQTTISLQALLAASSRHFFNTFTICS